MNTIMTVLGSVYRPQSSSVPPVGTISGVKSLNKYSAKKRIALVLWLAVAISAAAMVSVAATSVTTKAAAAKGVVAPVKFAAVGCG